MNFDKNIPVPEKAGGRKSDIPYKSMEVGDSVFYDRKYTGIGTIAKRYGYKMAQRQVTENGILGTRVWRVA